MEIMSTLDSINDSSLKLYEALFNTVEGFEFGTAIYKSLSLITMIFKFPRLFLIVLISTS
jgi:hypothetical protein